MAAPTQSRRARLVLWLERLWIVAAIVIAIAQTITYTGLAALAAEWEYDRIGTYHPAITCLLLIALLGSPLVLWRILKRGRSTSADTAATRLRVTLGVTLTARNAAVVASIVTAGIFVCTAFLAWLLPGETGPAQRVAAAQAGPAPPLGAVDLYGTVLYDKVAIINQSTLFLPMRDRFAPIVGADAAQEKFRYFVEIPHDYQITPHQPGIYHGVLRRGGLPGDLERVYRYAGFDIAPDYYVLFVSRDAMLRPYYSDLYEIFVLLLFFCAMWTFCHYRAVRLRYRLSQMDDQSTTDDVAAPA